MKRLLAAAPVLLACAALLAPTSALARHAHAASRHAAAEKTESKTLGAFKSWRAYEAVTGKRRQCYLAGSPSRSEPKRKAYIMIGDDTQAGTRDVIEVNMGAALKKGSEVILSVGKEHFSLYTSHDTAWARQDAPVVKAMLRGSDVVVKGEDAKGKPLADRYDLDGLFRAHKAISEACK